ncbi:hypothetical protein D3C85_285690 [compost metagenome]
MGQPAERLAPRVRHRHGAAGAARPAPRAAHRLAVGGRHAAGAGGRTVRAGRHRAGSRPPLQRQRRAAVDRCPGADRHCAHRRAQRLHQARAHLVAPSQHCGRQGDPRRRGGARPAPRHPGVRHRCGGTRPCIGGQRRGQRQAGCQPDAGQAADRLPDRRRHLRRVPRGGRAGRRQPLRAVRAGHRGRHFRPGSDHRPDPARQRAGQHAEPAVRAGQPGWTGAGLPERSGPRHRPQGQQELPGRQPVQHHRQAAGRRRAPSLRAGLPDRRRHAESRRRTQADRATGSRRQRR